MPTPLAIPAITARLERPFLDLPGEAHAVPRRHHVANGVQLSTLLPIKTGGCARIAAIARDRSGSAGVDSDAALFGKLGLFALDTRDGGREAAA